MKLIKSLFIIFLITLISCESTLESKKNDFSLKTNAAKGNISNSEILNITLLNQKKHNIDSVSYQLDGKVIQNKQELNEVKLGKHNIEANIYYKNEKITISTPITILNDKAPKIYEFKIIKEYPHDVTSYTQGLEFYNDTLYEGTGQYKESKLKKINYQTGTIYKSINLNDAYFGEGITVLNDKVYQLTWRKNTGFVYDATTLNKLSSFQYRNSKQGWGLCNDGVKLYKSDGSEKIWILNPDTLEEESYIQVCTNTGMITMINEMEWVNGLIYANRYQKDGVAIINPKNGAVVGAINFKSLKQKIKKLANWDDLNNVLNGIAYNPKTKTIFVTGKYWNKLFEVEIIEKQ